MATIVHFEPADQRLSWKLHVWQANASWDLTATTNGKFLDFSLPVVADVRKLRFKFRSIDPVSQQEIWESDDYIRAINTLKPEEVWTFSGSARISYKQPFPTTVKFNVGDKIYLSVFTRNQYKGGQVYIWNPYQVGSPTLILDETARNDQSFTSTFTITLTAWMVNGFHFKLTKINAWEPELSNRFWRPDDGANLWIKAGQVDVRQEALATVNLPIEVLVPSASPDPKLALIDLYDNYNGDLQSISSTAYPASNRFRIVNYQAQIFPGAAYNLTTKNNPENPNITLPFPSNPDDLNSVSRLALGVADWQASFPETVSNIILVIEPAKTNSGLGNGFDVAIGLGNAHAYQTASAVKQHNGLWQVVLESLPNITTSIQLLPVNGQESKLYDWIDTSRTLLPPTDPSTFYTTEGVFGISSSGVSQFSEPADRNAVLAAAFSKAIVDNGVFENYELPHGATLVENSVYFVIHAPHAVTCALVLVQQNTQGHASRNIIDMFLTNDRRYWWCQVPAVDAPPSTRYRFRLNENIEVLDPAAREISKGNLWETTVSDDPADPNTTWSLVLDTLAVYNAAHRQPWQTLGWDALVIYELHAKRFTDIQSDNLTPLALLADELQPVSRTGQPGYLYKLPVTALELLPIHEFKPNSSWGYNPAGYFAIESTYGGAYALAEFVNSAHASGRGVILDLVYNHSQDSPLVKIARDVYRNGDSYGDRVNCGHPIVLEFLRQASIHLWRTFGIDGFRFDDTKTIVTLCQGGWQFLGAIREAIRKAATAEGRAWPYCVAENDPKVWDIPNPNWSVMDGEWAIDEVFRILDASYGTWPDHANFDNAHDLKKEMDNPFLPNRPFSIATRFGESHDIVSGQNPANKRIAARPPFDQGLQLAKALGTLTLLSNGVPMLFMGQEVAETRYFSFDNNGPVTNPQIYDLPTDAATAQTRVLAWFKSIIGLRNDSSKGIRGNGNYQVVNTGRRTIAYTCGFNQNLFVIITYGTPDQHQNSSWLGLPAGSAYKEIFNSSWPVFQVESELEMTNGGYDAHISSGQILNLPWIGAVVLERRN